MLSKKPLLAITALPFQVTTTTSLTHGRQQAQDANTAKKLLGSALIKIDWLYGNSPLMETSLFKDFTVFSIDLHIELTLCPPQFLFSVTLEIYRSKL